MKDEGFYFPFYPAMSKKIYIIDGYNFIYRLFYAIPPFSLKDGTPVNTVFGMAKVLLSIWNEDKPDYLLFVLDSPTNLRKELYPEYKGTRERMPDQLRAQESIVFQMLETMKIPMLKVDGYEADDVIGTLVRKLEGDKENDIYILSGDKDLHQFVSDNVAIYDTMKRIIYRNEKTTEKFGVEPKYIVDYLAICGDSSDNIPGIPGFGPKKAQSLIESYGHLEDIYARIDETTGKTRETLEQYRETAFLSKQLATIHTDLSVDITSFEQYSYRDKPFFTSEVIDFFTRYEFRSLLPREHAENKKFESLNLDILEITETNKKEIQDVILSKPQISLATYGTDFSLVGGSFYLGEKEVYTFETTVTDMRDLFEKLLGSEVKIIGFELKEDLKRIRKYLEGASEET